MSVKKRVLFFGDSIMAQDKKPYEYAAEYNKDALGKICKGWPSILEESFNIETENFAIGGHKIIDQKDIILSQDLSNADYIVIAVGVNDFSQGTPIGVIPDSQEKCHDETFIGRYCSALDYIFTQNPLVKVVLMTPLHRCTLNRTSPGPVNTIDSLVNGNTLKDYADAIIQIGRFYACPVIDMYSVSGINRFNLELLTFEGVHPTDDGYKFSAWPIIDVFKKLEIEDKK